MTLGQLFQNKRQESGRSLEQLAALTKIHIKILRALETDTYTELPARAFTRGFIVNYAKALKLNPDQVLADHKEFLEQKFSERQDKDLGHQGYVFEGKEIEQTRRWMVIGASIAVVFAAATIFIFKPANHRHKEQHKDFEEEAVISSSEAPVDASASPVSSGTPLAMNANSLASSSASPNEMLAANLTAPSTPKMAATPLATPTPKAAATPSPASPSTPTPTLIPTPSPHAVAAAEAKATPAETEASPTPAQKEDKLLKGDDLEAKAVKYKITFQAVDDVWIRYKSDDKDSNVIVLRKGRLLAIKAAKRLLFEASSLEALNYKVKSAYNPLTVKKGEVGPNAAILEYDGSELGTKPLPDEVPPPRQ